MVIVGAFHQFHKGGPLSNLVTEIAKETKKKNTAFGIVNLTK